MDSIESHNKNANEVLSPMENDQSVIRSPLAVDRHVSFPYKVHRMLSEAAKEGKEDVASWTFSGRAFKVHKPTEFVEDIMPRFFNHTQYRSFQRQLLLYGFRQIKDKTSAERGSYYHKLFVRDNADISKQIPRQKQAKRLRRKTSDLSTESSESSSSAGGMEMVTNNTKNHHWPKLADDIFDPIMGVGKGYDIPNDIADEIILTFCMMGGRAA